MRDTDRTGPKYLVATNGLISALCRPVNLRDNSTAFPPTLSLSLSLSQVITPSREHRLRTSFTRACALRGDMFARSHPRLSGRRADARVQRQLKYINGEIAADKGGKRRRIGIVYLAGGSCNSTASYSLFEHVAREERMKIRAIRANIVNLCRDKG